MSNTYPMNNTNCVNCVHCKPTEEPHVWECEFNGYNLYTFDCFEPRSLATEYTSLALEHGGGY